MNLIVSHGWSVGGINSVTQAYNIFPVFLMFEILGFWCLETFITISVMDWLLAEKQHFLPVFNLSLSSVSSHFAFMKRMNFESPRLFPHTLLACFSIIQYYEGIFSPAFPFHFPHLSVFWVSFCILLSLARVPRVRDVTDACFTGTKAHPCISLQVCSPFLKVFYKHSGCC